MGEHDGGRAPRALPRPSEAKQRPFFASMIGAGFGGLLFVVAGLLLYIPEAAARVELFGDLGPSAGEEIGKYLLLPGFLGTLAGWAIGWAVRISRAKPAA